MPNEITQPLQAIRPGLLARLAAALIIAGFGLLNLANADWAHAVGVVCLICFVVVGFRAIIFAPGGVTNA